MRIVAQLVQHEVGDICAGDLRRSKKASYAWTALVLPAPGAVGQHSRPDQNPVGSAVRDHLLLSRLVPEIKRQNDGRDEKRRHHPSAERAVPESERGLADEALD